MNDKEFEELAAGHALHALSPEDEREFVEAIAADPLRPGRLRADEEAAARLADASAAVEPPRRVRAELLARIAELPQSPQPGDDAARTDSPAAGVNGAEDASEADARPTGNVSRRWFVLAASVALLVAVSAGAIVTVQSIMRPAAVTALDAIQDAPDAQVAEAPLAGGGSAALHWSAARGSAVLVSDDLPDIDADRQFELWLVRDGVPVPAGVFDAGGQTVALLEGDMKPGDVVAVTVEPAGGSPSGQPSTEPIVAIPTS